MAEAAVVQNDPDITVTIEPELPLNAEGESVKVETKKEAAKSDPAEELKAQFEEIKKREQEARERASAANARATAAQREADLARREAAEAKIDAADSQFGTIEEGLKAAQAEAEAAKRDMRVAVEAGDFDKQVEASERLAFAKAKQLRLDEAKSDLEARKAQAEKQPVRPQAPADPLEAYVTGRTEPTANWLRAHPDWVTDQKKNNKLTAAHYDAVSEGLSPDTKEYFDHVEQYIGIGKPESEKPAEPAKKKMTSPPSAPVIPSGGGTSGNSNEVRLTAGEARAAQDGTHVWGAHDLAAGRIKDKSLVGSPIGLSEMARRKLEMTKQGLYDRTWVEQ